MPGSIIISLAVPCGFHIQVTREINIKGESSTTQQQQQQKNVPCLSRRGVSANAEREREEVAGYDANRVKRVGKIHTYIF